MKRESQKQANDAGRPSIRQKPLVEAAYQGERGAFSELALKKAFPFFIRKPYPGFSDVVKHAEIGSGRCALLPVENSTEGTVREVYDLILRYQVEAVAEVIMRIRHMLLARHGVEPGDIRKVYSHPQALAQCKDYLKFRGLEAVQFSNTAAAVKMVSESTMTDAAAIGSENAAELYDMKTIDKDIEDDKKNRTRFLLVASKENAQAIKEMMEYDCDFAPKTSIVFGLRNRPGSLSRALDALKSADVNLTLVYSRPISGRSWEYSFYVDMEYSCPEAQIDEMLHHLKESTTFLKVVGHYGVAYQDAVLL